MFDIKFVIRDMNIIFFFEQPIRNENEGEGIKKYKRGKNSGPDYSNNYNRLKSKIDLFKRKKSTKKKSKTPTIDLQ